ncbi:MAG: PfkB family carbohydrate kinase, partial [Polyangiaceae bacterium]|nr:PfkB family carbohydrate kinase [Polyangiaceae bacterium]
PRRRKGIAFFFAFSLTQPKEFPFALPCAPLMSSSINKKPKIISWGEVLWDIFPDAEHLGGSAGNVAWHAAQRGAHSLLISRVGADDWGRRAIRQLQSGGVDVSALSVDPVRPTGTVRVSFHDGEPHYRVGERVAWDHIQADGALLDHISSADAICFGTLTQRGPFGRGRLRQALSEIRKKSFRRIGGGASGERPLLLLDINLRPPFTEHAVISEALESADLVKMSEGEEKFLQNIFQTQKLNQFLQEQFGIEFVVVTRGARGASLSGSCLHLEEPGLSIQERDPVGAGDAFVAALATELCKGASLPSALNAANQHGAWVASQLGAMPLAPL